MATSTPDPSVWVIPDAVSASWAILSVSCSFLALSMIIVPLRFWARKSQKAPFKADDWLMIPGWITFIGLCTCFIAGVGTHTTGYTQQEENAYGANRKNGAILVILADLFFALTLGLTKLSAIFFFKRVFVGTNHKSIFRTILNLSAIAITLWTVAFFILPLTFCQNHLEGLWYRPSYNKYCGIAHKYLLSGSITDSIFEFLVIILPVPKIWHLQTTIQRRLAVSLVFLTAILSVAASVARLAIISYLVAGHTVPDPDKANSAVFFIWALEAGAGITAVNMPSLWYLRNHKAPEKILRSLRSIISLRSISSKGSNSNSKVSVNPGNTNATDPTKTFQTGWSNHREQGNTTIQGPSDIETDSRSENVTYSSNDIKVTSHVSHTFENV